VEGQEGPTLRATWTARRCSTGIGTAGSVELGPAVRWALDRVATVTGEGPVGHRATDAVQGGRGVPGFVAVQAPVVGPGPTRIGGASDSDGSHLRLGPSTRS
jgi:hypothetical protein